MRRPVSGGMLYAPKLSTCSRPFHSSASLARAVAASAARRVSASHSVMKCFSNRRLDFSAPSSVSITDFALVAGS